MGWTQIGWAWTKTVGGAVLRGPSAGGRTPLPENLCPGPRSMRNWQQGIAQEARVDRRWAVADKRRAVGGGRWAVCGGPCFGRLDALDEVVGCVYKYICIFICIHIYIYIHTHIYICITLCITLFIYIYISYTYNTVYIYKYICVYVERKIYTNMHTHREYPVNTPMNISVTTLYRISRQRYASLSLFLSLYICIWLSILGTA